MYALYPQESSSIPARYVIAYGTRISGTLGNPPFLASYLLLAGCIGLVLMVRTDSPVLKGWYLLTTLLYLVTIYFTATRGPILSVAIAAAVYAGFYVFKRATQSPEYILKRTAVFILLFFVLSALLFFMVKDEEIFRENRVISRFASIPTDTSVSTRLRAWTMAWEGITARPILGWGQENFISLHTSVPIPFARSPEWLDRAHNILLHWLVNAGLLGMVSYISIFIAAVAALKRLVTQKVMAGKEAAVILITLGVYFIQNLFTFDTINTYFIFFALLAYIGSYKGMGAESLRKSDQEGERRSFHRAGITIIALMVFAITAYVVNYKPMRQAQIARKSSVLLPVQASYLTLLRDFKSALSYNTFGDTYVRSQMASVVNAIYIHKLFAQEGAVKFIQSTAEELYRGVSDNRSDLKYLTEVINFSMRLALYEPLFIERTEALIKACLRINPDYQWLSVALADLHALRGEYDRAYSVVKDVLSSDPRNDHVLVKMAQVSILTGREREAEQAIETSRHIRMTKNGASDEFDFAVFSFNELYFIAQAYREVGKYEKAIQYYREMIRREPQSADLHKETAEIYRILGDNTGAEREVALAAELDAKDLLLRSQEVSD
jgi:tetratricopeptide (TPR) repeat protein